MEEDHYRRYKTLETCLLTNKDPVELKTFRKYWRILDPTDLIPIKGITRLCNPNLGVQPTCFINRPASSFAIYRDVLSQRAKSQPQLFLRQHWRMETDGKEELRAYTYEHFQEFVRKCDWNQEDAEMPPIIICAHGTTLETGLSIARNGFATLASLDAGYFGKGIYFSTFATYTIPYVS